MGSANMNSTSNSTSSTSDSSHNFVLWRYDPSVPAAVIFAVLFFLTTTLHVWQAARKRIFYFAPLIIGGIFEVLGYIDRVLAHSHKDSLGIYAIQLTLLLVAPALFAASIYMVLGRLVRFTHGEPYAPIRPTILTKLFVCGDVFTFLIQAGGGGLMAHGSSQKTGKALVVIGLVLQIVFFGIFVLTSAIFHYRFLRSPALRFAAPRWQQCLWALYFASALILVRSVVRIFEFLGGNEGVIMTHEWYLYVFDAFLMLLVLVIFNVVHPGSIIGPVDVSGREVQRSRRGEVEELQSFEDEGEARLKSSPREG